MSEDRKDPQSANVYYLKKSNHQSIIYMQIKGIMDSAQTLIDSGSSSNFIDSHYVERNNIETVPLSTKKSVIAIDGKETIEKISRKVTLEIDVEGKTLKCVFYVMALGDVEVILGNDWLNEADPIIGWKDLSITYKENLIGKSANSKSDIPTEFKDFLDLFQEEGFSELPSHREYDCAIDFKEGAQLPPPGKVYPMSPIESRAIEEYLSKELKDGKIRRSNSPVAAP
jgi:hypothetical protein